MEEKERTLTMKPVRPGGAAWREVSDLYREAFPENERRSLFRLWLLEKRRGTVLILAYYRENTFAGLSITASNQKYLYLAYIAVSPEMRSEGIGREILSLLRQKFPGVSILVEVEAPNPEAENQPQRLRRLHFYERNGFIDLGREITGRGDIYRLYATDADYDKTAYFELLQEMSTGLRALARNVLHR